jgi:hypothetical protein
VTPTHHAAGCPQRHVTVWTAPVGHAVAAADILDTRIRTHTSSVQFQSAGAYASGGQSDYVMRSDHDELLKFRSQWSQNQDGELGFRTSLQVPCLLHSNVHLLLNLVAAAPSVPSASVHSRAVRVLPRYALQLSTHCSHPNPVAGLSRTHR